MRTMRRIEWLGKARSYSPTPDGPVLHVEIAAGHREAGRQINVQLSPQQIRSMYQSLLDEEK